MGKVKGKVHSMQGPLPIETNANETGSTFIQHHFFSFAEFKVEISLKKPKSKRVPKLSKMAWDGEGPLPPSSPERIDGAEW